MLLPAWAKSQPTALVRHRCPAEECECRFGSHGSWETGQLSNFTSQNWSNIWMSSVKSSLRSFLHDFAWASPKGSWTAGSFGNRRIQTWKALQDPGFQFLCHLLSRLVMFRPACAPKKIWTEVDNLWIPLACQHLDSWDARARVLNGIKLCCCGLLE
jgi:hypothetical protein